MAMTLQLILLLALSSGLWMEANALCHKKGGCCERCPDGWTQIKERCFLYYATPKDWCAAETECTSIGGNLISIHNDDDKAAVKSIMKKNGVKYVWTGTHDGVKNGCWLNSDGSEHYKKWIDTNGKAGEDCLQSDDSAKPVAASCASTSSFLCATDVAPLD